MKMHEIKIKVPVISLPKLPKPRLPRFERTRTRLSNGLYKLGHIVLPKES